METIVVFIGLIMLVVCQDFAYPADDQVESTTKKRVPLYIPGRCPENQLLYPGDTDTDWICDCGAGYVYYAPKDGCFRAYRRGPCGPNQMLMVPKKKTASECVENACRTDGWASYKGECYELDKNNGPCSRLDTFGVNITTLDIGCLQGAEKLSIFTFPPRCPKGSKRATGKQACRPTYE